MGNPIAPDDLEINQPVLFIPTETILTQLATSMSTTASGKYSVGYYVNWAIYGRKYPPQLIPVHNLTHVLYAFANVTASTGTVVLTDSWADEQIHYPGDSWDESGNNLYGNLKAIYLLKKANRHLKSLLSIGGWTYSANFNPVVVSSTLRAEFVKSTVQLLEDYGFDGIDIDYEYPSSPDQVAAPCGPQNYTLLDIAGMDKSLDFWNLMAYDFSGSWDTAAHNQANVYGTPINSNDAVQYYHSKGVAFSKLVLGVPLYGRSFTNTGGLNKAFNGVGIGTWEAGVYDYRCLPLPGSKVTDDSKNIASSEYNGSTKELVSYDDENVAKWKGQYIKKEGLGGSMFWELSGDKGTDPRAGIETGPGKDPQPGASLVTTVKAAMGALDTGENWLQYEGSKFDNLRKGMA
ncbi:hypothetical protein NP233_g4476 [Leucocoprinus birnbaumii]|uniref:GH18 domain-containing protein n=1 Tax=Leucocoprinus birnbaumii TaxID=56174 RepID=A0AAD5W118_9AGAR|nr:hypothetical protein NP233_g4476 [Leucocoprinus birnbaumii]